MIILFNFDRDTSTPLTFRLSLSIFQTIRVPSPAVRKQAERLFVQRSTVASPCIPLLAEFPQRGCPNSMSQTITEPQSLPPSDIKKVSLMEKMTASTLTLCSSYEDIIVRSWKFQRITWACKIFQICWDESISICAVCGILIQVIFINFTIPTNYACAKYIVYHFR